MPHMEQTASQVEWKKGSAELLILSLVEPARAMVTKSANSLRSGRAERFVLMSLRSIRCSTGWKGAAGCVDAGLKKADNAGDVITV